MAETITVMGAGGTMGSRICSNLRARSTYQIRCVEPDPAARAQLEAQEFETVDRAAAIPGADAVILSVPDHVIGSLCAELIPELDPDTLVCLLDPTAAYAEVVPTVDEVPIFITHPCHPPLFGDAPDTDWFGGQGEAAQSLVCALYHGTDADYARGESLARDVFAPVSATYRLTVEQLARLEPALVEHLLTTCLLAVQAGADQLRAAGIPEDAITAMVLGHLRTQLAMFFGDLDHQLSAGAERAVAQGRSQVLAEDWDAVLAPDRLKENASEIATLHPASE